ncbi:MAG TPA: DoxX family membrane protein [Candidatus Desulfofervidus auxilii]|uniref:DoxX family membrane protein n=1 Tax=Desulfofervidus auxilii TaxID=1621989 RepID=A0A7C0Y8Y3_DESA2|nr:DoxX family membrane protein [Candidatus Desulfofervidus auxilii]
MKRKINALFRIMLGIIFIYASIHKLIDPYTFAETVYNYNLLPENFVNAFAVILPWLEIICGFFLIIGLYKQGSLLIINFLLILFSISIGINLYRGNNNDCGCFGIETIDKLNLPHLIANIFLILIGTYIFLYDPKINNYD